MKHTNSKAKTREKQSSQSSNRAVAKASTTDTNTNITTTDHFHQKKPPSPLANLPGSGSNSMAKLQQSISSKIANERKAKAAAAKAAAEAAATAIPAATPNPIVKFGNDMFRSIQLMVTPTTTPKVVSPELPPIYGYGYSEKVIRWCQGVTVAALTTAGIASQAAVIQQKETSSQQSPPKSPKPPPSNLIVTETVLDEWVSVWQRQSDGCLVYLLGTTHRKTRSMEMARQLVNDVHPKAVFVELDLSRIHSDALRLPIPIPSSIFGKMPAVSDTTTTTKRNTTNSSNKTITWVYPKRLSLFEKWSQRIQQQQRPLPQFQKQTLYLQTTIKDHHHNNNNNYEPPMINEFYYAIRAGQKKGAAIVLGDQAYSVTKSRQRLAFVLEIFNMIFARDTSKQSVNTQRLADLVKKKKENGNDDNNNDDESETFDINDIQLDRIEGTREQTRYALGLIKELNPAIHRAMMQERDECLAANLHALKEYETVVAVLGKMHMDGVEKLLESYGWTPVDLSKFRVQENGLRENPQLDDLNETARNGDAAVATSTAHSKNNVTEATTST